MQGCRLNRGDLAREPVGRREGRNLQRRLVGSASGAEMEAACKKMATQAEALYELTASESFWQKFSRQD